MAWEDFYTSGEARRVFDEGQIKAAGAAIRVLMENDSAGVWRVLPPRDTSIVTFKDWLLARERPTILTDPLVPRDTVVVFDSNVSGFDQFHVSIDPGLRTGAPMTFVHFDEAPVDD